MIHANPQQRATAGGLVLAAMMLAQPAEAHLNSTGLGPIYDGMAHFLMSAEDLVPVLALALLAGLRGPAFGRRALVTLPVAWLAGSALGALTSATTTTPVLSASWFVLVGGLVAANLRLSLALVTTLAALLGVQHGYVNGSGMGVSVAAVLALLGLVSAIFTVVALTAAFVVRLRAEWARIGIRVAGSWIAATGLLLFGWAARSS